MSSNVPYNNPPYGNTPPPGGYSGGPGGFGPVPPAPPTPPAPPLLISAVRGPLVLIVLGVLFQLDQAGEYSFVKTWPVLLIVYAVLKLAESMAVRRAAEAEPFGGLR